MPILHKPKHPVVDPDPSMGRTIGNFNLTDYRNLLGFTGVGFGFGFFGSRMQLRARNAVFLAGIGLIAGISYASQSSMQRLMGLEPNESEVIRYGVCSAAKMAEFERKGKVANVELIDSPAAK